MIGLSKSYYPFCVCVNIWGIMAPGNRTRDDKGMVNMV